MSLTRRQFLSSTAAAALLVPSTAIFLPPLGGWPSGLTYRLRCYPHDTRFAFAAVSPDPADGIYLDNQFCWYDEFFSLLERNLVGSISS